MLEKELAYLESHKKELLAHHLGQYVLIKGNELVGAYTTESEAYTVGLKKFGNQPMLIRKIVEDEPFTSVPSITLGL
jgi:hypothetical protein